MDENKRINKFVGAWKNVTDKEAEEMKKAIRELRKRGTKELFKKVKDLK